jgi:putative flippase GtrA
VIRQQITRFVLVGLGTNAALYVAYLLLTRSLLPPKAAMTVVYVIGVALGFAGNRYWSFRHSTPSRGSVVRYLMAYAAGYVVNLTGLEIGVNRFGMPHEWVQGCMLLVVAIVMFLLQRYFVFNEWRRA